MKFLERSHFKSIFAKTLNTEKNYQLSPPLSKEYKLGEFFAEKFANLMEANNLSRAEFADIYYPFALTTQQCSVSKLGKLLSPEKYNDLPGLIGLLRVSYHFDLPFSYWMPDVFEERALKVKDIRTEKLVSMIELLPLKKYQQMYRWIQAEIDEFESDCLVVGKCPVQWTDGVPSAYVMPSLFEERLFCVLSFLNIQIAELQSKAGFNANTFYQRNYRRAKKAIDGEEANENVFGIRTGEFLNLCVSIGVSPDYLLGTKWQVDSITDDDQDTEGLKKMVMRLPYCSVCTLMTIVYNESAKKERRISFLSEDEKNTFGFPARVKKQTDSKQP